MRTGKPIGAPPRLSGGSPVLPLKQFKTTHSVARWPSGLGVHWPQHLGPQNSRHSGDVGSNPARAIPAAHIDIG